MVDAGLFNVENISIIVPPSAFSREAFVMVSSDESLVYNWKVPDYIIEAMNADTPYVLLENGVPELGLEGAQLVILEKQESPLTPGFHFFYVSVIPMQEKID